jgi:hypothetical protein
MHIHQKMPDLIGEAATPIACVDQKTVLAFRATR